MKEKHKYVRDTDVTIDPRMKDNPKDARDTHVTIEGKRTF